jgi:hypothetical protein
VIATGSNDAKLAVVGQLGADAVVNVLTEPVQERILDLTGGRGADVFCDPVGGELFVISLRAIAPLGRILVIGFTSGVFPVARANILLIKAVSVIGANYGHFLATETAQARVQVERMLGWIAEGRFSPHIHRRFAFSECVAALAARQIVGKCIIATQEVQGPPWLSAAGDVPSAANGGPEPPSRRTPFAEEQSNVRSALDFPIRLCRSHSFGYGQDTPLVAAGALDRPGGGSVAGPHRSLW